jgi:2-polyprenyl-6-methoxyphenol hydroxylase-like FAD-dependent oxidoreductase
MQKIKDIAVVGAGLGGLTSAIALRQGFNVTVYEQSSSLAEIGAGVQLSPNAMKVLRAKGQRVSVDFSHTFFGWAAAAICSHRLQVRRMEMSNEIGSRVRYGRRFGGHRFGSSTFQPRDQEIQVTDHGLRMAVDTDSFVILLRSAPPADRFP